LSSRVSTMMKWVGIATALISFGTAVYALIHSAGELRDHKRVFQEQLKSGRAQEAAGDFANAWDSFMHAEATVADEGVFAKLLGGLSAEQSQVRMAEQDLAMEWLRSSRVPEGTQFSTIADKLVGVLTIGANSSNGPRKADLLAHLGWAYFLKRRDGDESLRPDTEYREALAADAKNPYANVFWGHWILWNHGALNEANERFSVALTSDRARGVVRHFQLAALTNVRSNDSDAAYLRAVSDMLAAKEVIDASVRDEVCNSYAQALEDAALTQRINAAVSPSRQVQLLQAILTTEGVPETQKATLNVALAEALEEAGRPQEALESWKKIAAELNSQPPSIFNERVEAAIRRLGRKQW
jgi:tetratricopeptide (TPR) repeat protein